MGDFEGCSSINIPFPTVATTPPREHSPGRLGEDPEVGPPSRYSVEHRLFPISAQTGVPFDEWRQGWFFEFQREEELWEAAQRLWELDGEELGVDIPGGF